MFMYGLTKDILSRGQKQGGGATLSHGRKGLSERKKSHMGWWVSKLSFKNCFAMLCASLEDHL